MSYGISFGICFSSLLLISGEKKVLVRFDMKAVIFFPLWLVGTTFISCNDVLLYVFFYFDPNCDTNKQASKQMCGRLQSSPQLFTTHISS